jgi:membrane protease YdiL (CAAX protease family)
MHRFIQTKPLLSYFIFTFSVTWLLIFPILLSQKGFNIIQLPDALSLIFFILALMLGPLLSAIIVTRISVGKKEVKPFLMRIIQWKVGLKWYLVVLLGYPLVLVAGLAIFYGANAPMILTQKWQLYFTIFLAAILPNMILPALGEEPGWRGFALPRLQILYGPFIGTLILGFLHAMWHFPAYFVQGAITDHFTISVFAINSLAIMISSFLWTWVFNNAKQSILIAMLLHAGSNAISALTPLISTSTDEWMIVKIFGSAALLVIILTKGKLGYR